MEIEPVDKDEWKTNIIAIYDKMKIHKDAYDIQFGDRTITVLPNVFSPKYFTDSLYFAEQLPTIVGDKSLLEIGTGTGIIALYCALGGAQVVATDINPDAIENARINFAKYHLDIPVIQSDIYKTLNAGSKFDFIFWNHPFNNWDEPVTETLLRSGLDYHYQDLTDYIAGARQHLTEGGRLLLGTGNNADLATIQRLASDNSYSLRLITEEVLPLEQDGALINSYLIYEFVTS